MLSRSSVNRRAMLVASGCGLAGLPWGRVTRAAEAPAVTSHPASSGQAKSTILFFLCGGASHIDLWDMKPHAAAEYRGPFEPIATSTPGVVLCEHLPLLARQAHHLALVNSVGSTVNTNDHHAGYYYNLTGHVPDPTFLSLGNNRTPQPDDWPFMGAVATSQLARSADLPGAITLPHMPSYRPYTRPGQFAARIGLEHDPVYVDGSQEQPLVFRAPALELLPGNDPSRLLERRALLTAIDESRREFDVVAEGAIWNRQQQRAYELLSSSKTATAFDVAREPEEVRARYGKSVNAMSLLLARRLVEAGVPFITVFWLETGINSPLAKKCASEGAWDTHGNNFNCLREDLLPEFDLCFSALIEDLAARSLLDTTLVLISSEMGRTPRIGDPRSGGSYGNGRDHWTHCLTNVLAGGGIQGGQTYGASDPRAEYPAVNARTPADIAKTVYHAMGTTNLEATDSAGRPYNLLEAGEAITSLF
jgi:hypothetical protein